MSGMEVVRTRGGWAVRFEDGTRTGDMTRRTAGERLARIVAQRAGMAAAEAEGEARVAAWLAGHGIGAVDFRQLGQGDLFTWRPEVAPKVVTEVKHLESGASVVFWEPGRHTPAGFAVTLMTPGYQAYGRLERSA